MTESPIPNPKSPILNPQSSILKSTTEVCQSLHLHNTVRAGNGKSEHGIHDAGLGIGDWGLQTILAGTQYCSVQHAKHIVQPPRSFPMYNFFTFSFALSQIAAVLHRTVHCGCSDTPAAEISVHRPLAAVPGECHGTLTMGQSSE